MTNTPRVSIHWNGSVFVLTHNDTSGNTSYKYSYDGVIWEVADIPQSILSTNTAYSAKWVGDKTIVSGNHSTIQGNVVITSADGIHYSITKTDNGVQLRNIETNLEYRNTIVFNHTVDLALGGTSADPSKIAYSLDKTATWNRSVNSSGVFSISANHAVWNGRIWVAVGEGGNTIATSVDGSEWVGRGKYLLSQQASGVSWAKEQNRFVAVGYSGGTGPNVAYSVDGIFWLGETIPGLLEGKTVLWNGEIWVAGGIPKSDGNNCSIAYSFDGKSWTAVPGMFSVKTGTIEWNGTFWSAFGEDPSWNIATSPNGIQWTIEYRDSASPMAFYNDSFFLQETSGNTYIKSVDGINWETFSAIQDMSMSNVRHFTQNVSNEAVASIQPLSIATGEGINTLAYSADGIFWTGLGSNVFTERANKAVWNGRIWVAVGKGSNWIATSYDGLIWTGRENTLLVEGYDVAWNGEMFVATGQGSTCIAISIDGIHWEAIPNSTSIFSIRASGIVWTGRVWLAYGSGGNTTAYSENGRSWTPTTYKNMTIYDISNVFWESGYFKYSVEAQALTAPNMVATQSSYLTIPNNIYTATFAFDNNTVTSWRSVYDKYESGTGIYLGTTTTTYTSLQNEILSVSGEWIQLAIPSSVVVKYYHLTFTTFSIDQYSLISNPREWTFVGSNNGIDWNEIHTFAFSVSTPPNNVWKNANFVLPINIYDNAQSYSYYRFVVKRTFGGIYSAITGLNLYIENANSTILSIYEKPISLKNNVLFPFARNYSLADLSLNMLYGNPMNGDMYINSRFYGLTSPPITSVCFDGEHYFLTDISGNVSYMTNEATNTHFNVDTSYNQVKVNPRLSSVYGSCWNQQFVLFCGVGGITYGRLEAGPTWNATNASRLFSTVFGVASNSGYGFTYVPNVVYLQTNEILRVVGPKAYTMPGETAVKFNLHNSNIH